MNTEKKKLLKEIESKKNKQTAPKENVVSLEQIELHVRKMTDELNNVVGILCKNIAAMTAEIKKLKENKEGVCP